MIIDYEATNKAILVKYIYCRRCGRRMPIGQAVSAWIRSQGYDWQFWFCSERCAIEYNLGEEPD